MIDDQHFIRINPADCILEDKAEGTQIRPLAVGMIVTYELHLVRDCELIVQFLKLVIDQSRKHRKFSTCPPVFHHRTYLV